MRALSLGLLLTSGLCQLSCAATSGQQWLEVPIEPQAVPPSEASAAVESVPAARPRLTHTITLGEIDASSPSVAVAATPAAGNGSPVQVGADRAPVTVYDYASYGADYPRAAAPPAPAQGAPPQPGQDFPSPPSYGPSFPFSSGPAAPWAR